MSLVSHAAGLVSKHGWKALLDKELLLSEKHLHFRVDGVMLSAFLGGFAGLYHMINCLLRRIRDKQDGYNALISGTLASVTVLTQDADRRRTLALYIFIRAVQSSYNAAKARNWFHFYGSSWRHGDTLLFALGSSQVMYSWIMRPETLPVSFVKFISRTGPIHPVARAAVRFQQRGIPVDLELIHKHLVQQKGSVLDPLTTSFPSIIPCSVLHPGQPSCTMQQWDTFRNAFKAAVPMYASINMAATLLSLSKFFRSPLTYVFHAFTGTIQSAVFLAAFVQLYMTTICIQRRFVTHDHRWIYYFAGIISGLSVLIEKKNRRAELALYVLPRALEGLYNQGLDHSVLPFIENGDLYLFALSMGMLSYYFEHEPKMLAPLITTLFSNLLGDPDKNQSRKQIKQEKNNEDNNE